MINLPVYVLDRTINSDDIARFLPDGDELEVGDALIASGFLDNKTPAVLFKLPAASVLVLRNGLDELQTNLTADDLEADAAT